MRCQVRFLSPKMHFYPQTCSLILQNFPFISQKCSFVSWNCPFVFQKCFLISQKCPIFLQSFPELPSFCLLCASFSKDAFFPSWLYLLLGLIMAFQRDNICLVLVLFPLETIYWPTNDALHLACVHIEYDFFMYFINF